MWIAAARWASERERVGRAKERARESMFAVISGVRGACGTVYCIPCLKYTSHHKQLLHDELRALKPAVTRDLEDSQINKRTTKWGPNVQQSG